MGSLIFFSNLASQMSTDTNKVGMLYIYLSLCGRGNPSRCQMRVGGGLPLAMHLRDTEGPGWRVCSVNLNRKKGIASVRKRKQRI